MKIRNVILVCVAVVSMVFMSGCGSITRNIGGTETVDVPANQKLINCGWDDGDNLWYLTKPMGEKDTAETYTFTEDSNLGVAQGTVILVEHKK